MTRIDFDPGPLPSLRSSYERRPARFSDVDRASWESWHWQHQNRLRKLEHFEEVLTLSDAERRAFEQSAARFRVAVTPHYAALMATANPGCPVRQQGLPQPGELRHYDFELEDPLAEEAHMPVPGITHRYPDRVLFYVSHHCPVYCRHCTRKRKVSDPTTAAARDQIEAGLHYIRTTPTARDVVISGGDPLTLSDARLREILEALRSIEHVEVIRLGTRNPVTLPQRITPELCEILRAASPVFVHTHFNHPDELSQESARALRMLLDAGCVLGNQMVLLRGVNDQPETVMELNRQLLRLGCRPYYMLQCDMAAGISHFRTPLTTGLQIMDHLRGRIGGMGVPHFVVDLPGGGGKVELVPDQIEGRHDSPWGQVVTFRNFAGERFEFVDVDPPRLDAHGDDER
ncbi:KamA family radical SAM protein [Lujinxingia litoralis]|uniref:KamA family radical SAM protein n=1 Tax=Lujinxingia litoralis TaxID=2211119 RepID=UPI0018F60D56|nr:KamA family radical SAM protein [Lujinxingia litoralis]